MDNFYKVSVIVPCYNQAKYLDSCFSSLVNQIHTNWECILVDDGSTDNTREEGEKWAKIDSRIKYYRKANGGLSSARNFGLNLYTGDFVQFLDADDFLAPEKFDQSLQKVVHRENTVIITDFLLFDEKKKKEKPAYCKLEENCFNLQAILYEWDKRFTIPIHCAIFSSDLAKQHKFNEDLKAKEDWIFWLEIYKHQPQTHFVDKPLAFYRESLGSMTRRDDFMHENTVKALKIIEQVIKEPILLDHFLRYNNEYLLSENHLLKKEIARLRYKRTSKYKLEKLLRLFSGKKV